MMFHHHSSGLEPLQKNLLLQLVIPAQAEPRNVARCTARHLNDAGSTVILQCADQSPDAGLRGNN